jgi:hypothetical protein
MGVKRLPKKIAETSAKAWTGLAKVTRKATFVVVATDFFRQLDNGKVEPTSSMKNISHKNMQLQYHTGTS